VKLLLEAVYLQSGLEFRNYRRGLIKQRVVDSVRRERLKTISELQAAVLREPPVLERLLVCLTEHRTCPFADPAFYRAFRQEIVPWLRTYPFARIWVVGCAGGAETYSLAAVLLEEGLQERCRIYATDLCEPVVRQAQGGYWPLPAFKRAAAHYRSAGGKQDFSSYYTLEDGQARISAGLAKNVVFAAHNLMTDASFNEFHVVLCREAMDQFDPILQAQVHQLLYASLVPRGVLALGRRHQLGLTLHQSDYQPLIPRHGLYRKNWPN
jgi:chemotaxis protein methyltransferase CheR